jgi:hypothetical protein
MKSKLIILVCLFFAASAEGQNFQGEIVYANSYKSNIKTLTDEQLGQMIGTKQEYLIKGGSYRSYLNGVSVTMQQYDSKTNRMYNKTPKSDTLYWFDASINTDGVESFEIRKNAEVIIGNQCDAIIMKTKTGTTTVFYSSRYKVDRKIFEKHNYGNWAFVTSKVGALPLKTVIETLQFKMTSIAIEIKKMELGDDYFKIAPQTPLKKS